MRTIALFLAFCAASAAMAQEEQTVCQHAERALKRAYRSAEFYHCPRPPSPYDRTATMLVMRDNLSECQTLDEGIAALLEEHGDCVDEERLTPSDRGMIWRENRRLEESPPIPGEEFR